MYCEKFRNIKDALPSGVNNNIKITFFSETICLLGAELKGVNNEEDNNRSNMERERFLSYVY